MGAIRPPVSYRVVRSFLDLRLILSFLVVAAAFWAQANEAGDPLRDGIARGLGLEPEQFGPEQAGEVLGYVLIPMILLGIMRWLVSSGRVIGYRGLQIFDMLIALSYSPLAVFMGMFGLVLSFRGDYVEHSARLRGDTPSLEIG